VGVRLSPRCLDPRAALHELERARAGGVALFTGAVRADPTAAGPVVALWYEADQRMGLATLERIARDALAGPGVRRVVLWHRTGLVGAGEVSVVVGAAADHRAQAFDAARTLIERVKHEAPIWKSDRVRARRRPTRGRSRGS
jgi:molybdopterin synthase catalytic subunit